ncbi:MAG TPA: hypothetical protein VHE78_05050, partial [Gemmatimonadaceae bacterium]|nr:hypothetical protein [Gemmatimonadaceae bacterium]
SVAGVRKMRLNGTIGANERVVCVLTGHLLKDPEAVLAYHRTDVPGSGARNAPVEISAELDAVERVLRAAVPVRE